MKLMFVHECLGSFGGAEGNAHVTAAELKARGHVVGLLHGPGTGQGEAAWRETFVPRYPLAAKDNLAVVQEALWDFDPDLVYLHKMRDLEVLETLLASGIPLVRMVHDHDLYCMRSYKYHYASRRICRRRASLFCLLPCGAFLRRRRNGGFPLGWVSYVAQKKELRLNRQFHRLFVASYYMKEELLRNGFAPEKIEIHAPVPPPGESYARSSFGERNLIIYAGQIIRGKGVDVLLQALARIRVPFECLIFGDGHFKPFCQKLCRQLGLADRVQFRGFVTPAEIRAHYRDASVAVLSSVWPEPFGATGLEGMRYGLPVVAFDAGGIKEWLIDGYNGYLVPWMDRDRFAARVEELLVDKALARHLGECGRKLVNQEYDFAAYISGLEASFARVLAGHQERTPA